jgi:hypothetical protein
MLPGLLPVMKLGIWALQPEENKHASDQESPPPGNLFSPAILVTFGELGRSSEGNHIWNNSRAPKWAFKNAQSRE